MKHCLRMVVTVALSFAPSYVVAQDSWPIGLEFVLGPSRGFTTDNDLYGGSRAGVFGSFLGTIRLHAPERSGLIAGLELGGHLINVYQDDACKIAPGGGCIPHFPGRGGVSFLAGWESQSTNIRAIAGPGIVDPEYDRTLGITSRVDFALPIIPHISGVATVSNLFVPSWNGNGFYYVGLGVGLRVR